MNSRLQDNPIFNDYKPDDDHFYLKYRTLSINDIKDIVTFLNEKEYAHINHFWLNHCKIEKGGLSILLNALSAIPNITTLNLLECALDNEDAIVVAEWLKTNTTIHALSLGNNEINDMSNQIGPKGH